MFHRGIATKPIDSSMHTCHLIIPKTIAFVLYTALQPAGCSARRLRTPAQIENHYTGVEY
jgi:hypothetical protein